MLNEAARNLAADFPGVRALFPFEGPPYLPFQRWARRAEPVHPSPLRQLIHPEFGLWHAYRGALLFREKLHRPRPQRHPNPCQGTACIGYLEEQAGNGQKDFLGRGCLSRRACPVGLKYAYRPAQAGFHMQALLAAHGC